MPVNLTILGSGSSGNCAFLESGDTRILIDAGLSGRQIRHRLASIGRSPETLTGVLITHEHSDHIQGLGVIAAKLGVPVYCNRPTSEAIHRTLQEKLNFRLFETGNAFTVADFGVDCFPVPHDAQDPVGYVVHTSEGSVGFLTDLGYATKLIVERVRKTRILVLEANHDLKLLQEDTKRPWSVKQRILSRHGHLSNDAAAEVAEQVVTPELSHIFLGHLSRDCNTPELAHKTVTTRLKLMGADTHVKVEVSSQEQISATVSLTTRPTLAGNVL